MLLRKLRAWLQRIWKWLSRLFHFRKSSAGISQKSKGDRNLTIAKITTENLNFYLDLPPPSLSPPDAKFRFPEPFCRDKLRNFTGREKEIEQLNNLLIERKRFNNIVVIFGAPGVGKSALACYFATHFYERFPDGVYGLRVELEKGEIRVIARKFANLCGEIISSEDERDAPTIMADLFEDKQVLLIFDNAEQAEIRQLFPENIILSTGIKGTGEDREQGTGNREQGTGNREIL